MRIEVCGDKEEEFHGAMLIETSSVLLFKVFYKQCFLCKTKGEISYPNSFTMVRLTTPSNFKFPGLFHSQFFLEKTRAV